jgi:hypothetical protein
MLQLKMGLHETTWNSPLTLMQTDAEKKGKLCFICSFRSQQLIDRDWDREESGFTRTMLQQAEKSTAFGFDSSFSWLVLSLSLEPL